MEGRVQEIEEAPLTSVEGSFQAGSGMAGPAVDGLAAQRVALARALWPGRQLKALDSVQFAPEEVVTTGLAFPVCTYSLLLSGLSDNATGMK